MIRKLAGHRIAFLLLATLLLIQSFSADLNDPYKKPITGDAKGYYAYLPAIFIYHDLDYGFIAEVEKKYYPPGHAKSFVKEVDGEKVNKTFPGVTLLYLPFFLIAHGISLLSGLPADGYAYTYQLLYMIGFWFYALMGMIFFKKVLLKLNFSGNQADIALLLCVLGTNLYFYLLYDASVTHIYNFFLVNLAIYLLLLLKDRMVLTTLVFLLAVLAVIGITRPTNFLVFFIIPLFIPEKAFYTTLLGYLFHIKNVFISFVTAGLILLIPLILWKLQTGRWIVYSYGEEGFNFAHPEVMNFLFSYTKGWFVYTPLALFILVFGLVLLFRSDKPRAFTALLFYALSVYIFSSWWCWYYGAGMSQRVMIDYTMVLGFLIALILQFLQNRNALRMSALVVCLLLVSLNVAQAWQIAKGILPMGSPTREQYWDNFLVFQKQARVYPQEHWILTEEQKISFNPADGHLLKGTPYLEDNTWLINVSDTNDFSPVLRINTAHLKKGDKIIFAFDALATTPVTETRMTIGLEGMPGGPVYFLTAFIEENEWTPFEFLFEPRDINSSTIDFYFWNAGSKEKVEFKNFSFKRYHTDQYF